VGSQIRRILRALDVRDDFAARTPRPQMHGGWSENDGDGEAKTETARILVDAAVDELVTRLA
jgi:hypothetical protein